MLNLAGYEAVAQIYAGTRTLVYRAIQTAQQRPVIVKMLRSPSPTFNDLVKFRNQYVIAQHLHHPGVVQPLTLEAADNGYALVMPDEGAITLLDYWQGRAQTRRRLIQVCQIGIQLADALHYLGEQQVVHKDIKPNNILIHPTTGQVQLIDFSMASRLAKQEQQLLNPNDLAGTLAYLSPEQTGRMNRGIDYRTDFYSLGVTLYELLAGELPFHNADALALVHAHIAHAPPPLPDFIPEVLGALVLKLMAKNAEDRYQSALGLKYDLQHCAQAVEQTGTIAPFTLGDRDRGDRFLIPETLYGRETEVQQLLAAFERVADPDQNCPTLVLITGGSGIGKTAVVNEVHKPMTQQRGYFIKGKFDQFNRDLPLAAFVQAFRGLVGQLLGESDAALAQWQAKIVAALGKSGQVIMEVIPELEQILGPQPPVPDLFGAAAQQRFNLLLGKFIAVFATPEHPLVIFLDDLQWADGAALKLLKLLMTQIGCGSLLVLGAYRDYELTPDHPLCLTLADLHQHGVTHQTLTLGPLAARDVTRLVAQTLHCGGAAAQPLAELIYTKTQGNPFFTIQFLKGLYEDGCLRFDAVVGSWLCDLSQVRRLSLTQDVMTFMMGRLHRLPQATQTILKLAACMGNRFDLATLAIVCQTAQQTVATDLWPALQGDVVMPENETYKFFQGESILGGAEAAAGNTAQTSAVGYRFLHDRMQQAAYALIPTAEQPATHLHIGRLLQTQMPAAGDAEALFAVLSHLNRGTALITDAAERQALLELNHQGAMAAIAATAYAAADTYLQQAIALLPADPWHNAYDLTLVLHTLAAHVAYLMTEFAQTETRIATILDHCVQAVDGIKASELLVQVYIAQDRQQQAIETGLATLQNLGIPLVDRPDWRTHLPPLPEIEDLVSEPLLQDPIYLAALRILMTIAPPTHHVQPERFPAVVLTMVELCQTHGVSELAAYTYGLYGLLLDAHVGDPEQAHQSGRLSLQLLDGLPDRPLPTQTLYTKVNLLFAVFICACKEPGHVTLPLLKQAIEVGLAVGDIEYVSYCIMAHISHQVLLGLPLEAVTAFQEDYLPMLTQLKQEHCIEYSHIWLRTAATLQGHPPEPALLIAKQAYFEQTQNQQCLFALHLTQLILHYHQKNYATAIAHAEQALANQGAAFGILLVAAQHFYSSLALLAHNTAPPEAIAQTDLWATVIANQAKLAQLAAHAPENYQHQYDLVAAEMQRCQGNRLAALQLYDQAIAAATDHDYPHIAAIANERAAQFFLTWDKERIATSYLQAAYYGYARWQAMAKTQQLEQTDVYLLVSSPPPMPDIPSSSPTARSVTDGTGGTLTTSISILDLHSAIKAAQALSEEIELDALLTQLMRIVIENAGASQGMLLLNKNGSWEVAAQCRGDLCDLTPVSFQTATIVPRMLINTVRRTQETILLNNFIQANRFMGDPYFQHHPPQSVFCTPVLNQGQLLGVLYLENALTADAFTPSHLELLNVLTTQAAISIKNAQFYQTLEAQVAERTTQLAAANAEITQLHECLKAENVRMGAELDVARRVQEMLLPNAGELAAIPELDIASFMNPAEEVGGDYYDVLLEAGVVTISIGDVTGRGLESGLVMMMAQTMIRALTKLRENDPVRFLNTVNATLYENVERMGVDRNMSLTILSYADGRLTISGQHEDVLLVRADGHLERIDTIDLGITAGLTNDISEFIDQTQAQLQPGDGVVLYTDGMTKVKDANGEFYSLERLCTSIQHHWQQTAQGVIDGAIADVQAFMRAQKLSDDMTLLVLKRT